ncbi:MAG: DegT/DnrJ/EryC1/StrS family aminotransferase [Candidatus Omnitrophota bacterium]|jgi:perosamine synthetase
MTMKVPLSRPDIAEKDIEAVTRVLATPYLSRWKKLTEFEERMAAYIGTRYAVAVSSGTGGLHLCVRSLGIKDGDEVITTPFSFIASANCILFERARPVFVDIMPDTLNMDASKIEGSITPKTKAILAVHVFGHPCEMDEITRIARKYNLKVIEDASEAVGAEFKNRKVGRFSNAAAFSFYPNKQITTAEGGVIVTDNKDISNLCRSMRNQGRDDDACDIHHRIGFNYRMNELSAALGISQLKRIKGMLKARERVADMYSAELRKVGGIEVPFVSRDVTMSRFVYVIKLAIGYSRKDRDGVIAYLQSKGISCGKYFAPIHLQPCYVKMFGYKKGDFPITESVADRVIALPFYNHLTNEAIRYVCRALKRALL